MLQNTWSSPLLILSTRMRPMKTIGAHSCCDKKRIAVCLDRRKDRKAHMATILEILNTPDLYGSSKSSLSQWRVSRFVETSRKYAFVRFFSSIARLHDEQGGMDQVECQGECKLVRGWMARAWRRFFCWELISRGRGGLFSFPCLGHEILEGTFSF